MDAGPVHHVMGVHPGLCLSQNTMHMPRGNVSTSSPPEFGREPDSSKKIHFAMGEHAKFPRPTYKTVKDNISRYLAYLKTKTLLVN